MGAGEQDLEVNCPASKSPVAREEMVCLAAQMACLLFLNVPLFALSVGILA